MTPEAHGDMAAEIQDLRRRLGELEARGQVLPTAPRRQLRMLARGRVATLACALGLLTGAGLLYGQGAAKALALFVDPTGRVGIGTDNPRADLDVAGTLNVSGATSLANVNVQQALGVQGVATVGGLDVRGALTAAGKATLANAEIANATLTNATLANTTLGRATITGPLAAAGPVTVGNLPNAASLDVAGVLRAEVVEVTSPLKYRMYTSDAQIYQSIIEARDAKAIDRLNEGKGNYDATSWAGGWNNRRIIMYGASGGGADDGAKVAVPAGYNTLWVRVLGDRRTLIHAKYTGAGGEDLGKWSGGYRPTDSISPDGSVSDGDADKHQWIAIPVPRPGVVSLVPVVGTTDNFWVSGLAFSRNPWARAAQSSLGYVEALNGGTKLPWEGTRSAAAIQGGAVRELFVPVVPSGRDKLLYVVASNYAENGAMHTGISVNDVPIERFLSTYDNPFARHYNSVLNSRYLAARIPARLIPADARLLRVRIDMSAQSVAMYVREVGTHDLEVPWTRAEQVAAPR